MSEDNETPDVDDDTGKTGAPLAGQRLGEARRQQQISVVEVAKELHLDEYKIRALEDNQFDVLGAPVFAKGHLKKYAQLVGVKIDDVLAEYYELNRAAGMPPVVGDVRKPRRELSLGPWIAAFIAIVTVAAAYWYFAVRSGPDAPASPAAAVPQLSGDGSASRSGSGGTPVGDEPAVEMLAADETSGAEAAATETDVSAGPAPRMSGSGPDIEAAQRALSPAPLPAAADGEIRLSFRFSGDCWMEVRDANGQRLYTGIGREGRERDVAGLAPLSVVLGAAENVSIRVNGQEYRIADANRRGDAAVLTIPAP